jgi:RimJ/RimL family protein N-acetyltransferase
MDEKRLDKVEAAREKAVEVSKPPILKTERLELRPSMPEMFESVWAAIKASEAELAEWMHWAIELDPDATREYLARAEEAWESGHDRAFTLFMDGEACGQCSLDHTDPITMSAEIGYWMRSDLCGRNLMTEAAYAVVSYGFWQKDLHRIELHAGVDNHASIRVAEKLGFRKEGTHRDSGRGSNGFYDGYSFGLLIADERPALKGLDDPTSR